MLWQLMFNLFNRLQTRGLWVTVFDGSGLRSTLSVHRCLAALLRIREVISMDVSICLFRALSDTGGFDATNSCNKIFALLRLSHIACDFSFSRSVIAYAQHVKS